MYAVSKCLIGENVKYNGGNNYSEAVMKFLSGKKYITICPEVDGGLPTPRCPCEIVGDKVMSREGRDCTCEFVKGAQIALEKCKESGVTCAILQPRSPSCGVGTIYDGSFTGKKIDGFGIAASLLRDNGIEVISADKLNNE